MLHMQNLKCHQQKTQNVTLLDRLSESPSSTAHKTTDITDAKLYSIFLLYNLNIIIFHYCYN